MGEKVDSRFRDPIQGKWNRNSIRYSGNYGTDTFLSSSFNDNDLGRSMPLVGALYNEDGFRGGDELPRQVKLPCQNASHLDRQNHYDGNEPVKPPISGEFDDFGGRRGREDYTNHVRSIDSQWENDECDRSKQLVDSDGESKKNTGNRMVLPTCSERIRGLSSQLGPLLRVYTLEGNARTKKQPCHLVLPDNRPKIWKNENDSSVCQVSASDEFDGIYGYRSNSPIVIDTIMKSNRCHIANSTGFKLYDEDQEDYISYIKEELTGYIEEVKMYGFGHIIIIGELNYGLLFLDCFGRMFNLDSITSHLLLLGDYFKRVERVTKGLYTELASWIVDSDEGKIVEINGPEHYLIPFRKKQIEKEHMKKKKKKGSRKKHR